ncbi:MAG: efflux RND transporter periplasmic adaptor subunit [Pirellulaceae bacterium]|nr:efflux RND transporter periplasmic adaptor subunit [Pirellulaceae bacterium]
MKTILKLLVLAAVLGGAAAAAYNPVREYWKKRSQPDWRLAAVERGDIVTVVNSTGTVKPVLSVQVGSFVSGPITDVHVDFNERVERNQLLANVDPRLFQANVDRDQATLATRLADVSRAEAQLKQAENDWLRAQALFQESPEFISASEMDQYRFNFKSLEAQLALAQASVDQARASLKNSEQNLEYCEIHSPVAGIVIDRMIDPGQTLAASFQTPVLFIVAPNMEQKMHVYAAVDEADIGYIRAAQREQRPVRFTVDAYPDDLFEGRIEEVRFSSTTNQNVVTYPVVVSAPNPDLKLLPGMTASLSFEIDQRKDVMKVPNSALRFYPESKHVHPDDRKLLDGATLDQPEQQDEQFGEAEMSAMDKAAARRERSRRHVWVADGEFLRAVEVVVGASDSKFTELLTGKLSLGQQLVIGIKPKAAGF